MSESVRHELAIVAASRKILPSIHPALQLLHQYEVPYRLIGASLLNVDALQSELREAEQKGVQVFIVADDGSGTICGLVAAHTSRPVIGVPFSGSEKRDATRAALPLLRLPEGAEVLMVGVDNIEGAVRQAMKILALSDPEYKKIFAQMYFKLAGEFKEEGLAQADEPSRERQVEATDEEKPPKPQASAPQPFTPMKADDTASPSPKQPKPKRKSALIKVDPNHPDVETIEETADALLMGKVVALPTDTVYGLAVDATNELAVKELAALKDREPGHAIPVMICNEGQLKGLVKDVPDIVLNKVDDFWPGALTIVFKKFAGAFKAISSDDTIGIRIPDHYVMLGILSAINRPLAVTSANPSGSEPALTAQQVEQYFKGKLELILDGGPCESAEVSTVLAVHREPFEILREGSVGRERLREIFGDLLK